MPAKEKKAEKKDEGWKYIVIYFFTWLTGLIFYLAEKQDKKVRFHAIQSILLGIVITILSFTFIFSIISVLLWIYGLYVGYKEMKGETIRIPVIGEYAEKYA